MLCKKEAAFTYTESQQGKTAAEIRKEIMDGKWKEVDLSAYDTLPRCEVIAFRFEVWPNMTAGHIWFSSNLRRNTLHSLQP